jgi:EmrB/QacA subfamily drug resistance transporter
VDRGRLQQLSVDQRDTTPEVAISRTEQVALDSPQGRWLLLATVLGSSVALLDATVVNVALPAIGADLDASFAALQWTVNGYTLTLAAFILLGGSLGDRFGRRRVFLVGVAWFAAASVLCGLAANVEMLVAARVLQGVGGALLTPGSLALIFASFPAEDRGRAVGAWSALGGLSAAVGPFLGGVLVEVSWRLVFLLNVPLCAAVVGIALRHVPESADEEAPTSLDLAGAGTGVAGLGALTFGLVAAGEQGASPAVIACCAAGVLALAAFVVVERRARAPMLPVDIFRERQFTAANLVTFAVYAALGGVFFLLVVHLQVSSGYSPLLAGTALLPVTAAMLVLSPRSGALAERRGPRLPMTLGPLLCATGIALMLRIGVDADYVTDVLPAVVVFGVGLGTTVAPLTTAALAAAPSRHAGVASGVNNAVARTAQLLAVAVLPVVAGITGADYADPATFAEGFRVAMLVAGGLLLTGGTLAFFTISDEGALARRRIRERRRHCAVDGPPVEPAPPSRSPSPGT